MAVIDVTLGRRNYQLACDDGQEVHVRGLASKVNDRLEALAKDLDGTSDNMMLVMATIMMQDELNDGGKLASKASDPQANIEDEIDDALSDALATIADYVESLANRFEKR